MYSPLKVELEELGELRMFQKLANLSLDSFPVSKSSSTCTPGASRPYLWSRRDRGEWRPVSGCIECGEVHEIWRFLILLASWVILQASGLVFLWSDFVLNHTTSLSISILQYLLSCGCGSGTGAIFVPGAKGQGSMWDPVRSRRQCDHETAEAVWSWDCGGSVLNDL